LKFSGIFASKWVSDSDNFKTLSDLLRRMQAIGGQVQFLTVNPFSEGARLIARIRQKTSDSRRDSEFLLKKWRSRDTRFGKIETSAGRHLT
jgi:hypothetical protein